MTALRTAGEPVAETLPPATGPSRRARRVLAAVIALLLISGVSMAYLRQDAQVVTVDQAVEQFRAGRAGGDSTVGPAPAGEQGTDPSAGGASSAAAPAAGTAGGSGSPAASPAGASAPSASPAAATGSATAKPGASATPAPAPEKRAAEGVYTYDTKGYEATDAVGGARHDYPESTAITLRHNGCGGSVQRWQPLSERWDESELCNEAGGVSIRRFTTFHEFFKQRQQQEFLCPEGTHVYRFAAAPGESWEWTCKAGGSAFATKVTFVGFEDIVIGGQPRRAARMFYDSTMTGANRGTQKQERWLDPDTGLLYKMTTDIVTEADSPFGAVNYEEHYVLTLTSTTPRT